MSNEYTTKSLDESLDQKQLQVVTRLIDQIRTGATPTVALRTYLRSIQKDLETRGVLPDYLYYALCYKFNLS